MNIYVRYRFYGGTMYEENRILSKIEQWVDKLPYKTAEIRIEMADKTYTLTKDKKRPIGFQSGSK